MQVCTTCQVNLPLSSYGYRKKGKNNLARICKPCNSKRGSIRYAENKDYIKQISKIRREVSRERVLEIENASREKHKEKNRPIKNARQSIRNRLISNKEFLISEKELKKIYTDPCFNCGSLENQSLDHILPLVKGGSHSIGNIMTLCLTCNTKKHAKFLMEWKLSNRKGSD